MAAYDLIIRNATVVDGARDLIKSRHVHLQRQYATADPFNLACQLTSRVRIPQTQRHISAGVSKS